MIEQDRTAVVPGFDGFKGGAETGGDIQVIGNDANRFDMWTQTDQPPGPFPAAADSAPPATDGDNGVK